jgi:hypothetical protein
MLSLLSAGHAPGADDSDSVAPITMCDHERLSLARESERKEPLLTLRMVRIIVGVRERIIEDGRGLLEAHAVLLKISSSLL